MKIIHEIINRGKGSYGSGEEQLTREQLLRIYDETKSISSLILTTNGTSGAATYNSATRTLNIPVYTQSAVDGFVPYTGATANLNLGANQLIADAIQLSLLPVSPTAPGKLRWNADSGTLDIGMGYTDVVQQVGMDTYYPPIKNQTGSTIAKGTVVMSVGTLGASGRILVAPAVANGTIESRFMLGIAATDMINEADGLAIWFGEMKGFNTVSKAPAGETWINGDVLWINPAIPGGLTKNEPLAPNLKVSIAQVLYAATNGIIVIRPSLGSRLTDLHDVNAFTPATNDLISYDGVKWVNNSRVDVVLNTPLTGFETGSNTTIAGTDTILGAFQKAQGQINARVSGTIASGQVAFGTGVNTVSGDSGLTYNSTTQALTIGSAISTAIKLNVLGQTAFTPLSLGSITIGSPNGANGIVFFANSATTERFDIRRTNTSVFLCVSVNSSAPDQANGITILNNGSVGIRVISPTNTLDVNGTGRIRNGVSLADISGNVQIGTTTDAGFRLDVNGTARVQGALTTNLTAGRVPFIGTGGVLSDDSSFSWDNSTKLLLNISEQGVVNRGTNSANLFSSQNSSATGNPTQFRILHDGANSAIDSIRGALLIRTNSVNRIIIDRNSGNVMINTGTDAGFRLDVNGTARVQGNFTIVDTGPMISAQATNNVSGLRIDITSDGDVFRLQKSGVTKINLKGTDLLGIFTTSPTASLDVNGTARIRTLSNASGDFVTSNVDGVLSRRTAAQVLTDIGAQATLTNPVTGTGTSGQVAFWSGTGTQSGDSGLFWDNTNKRLGVRTTSPSSDLGVFLQNTTGGGISLQAIAGSTYARFGIVNPTINNDSYIGSFTNNNFLFYVNGIERGRFGTTGNFLINTTTDSGFRLDVNGSTRFNGLSTIQGTTASDSGQLGSELLTTGSSDASWTGSSFATGYTHVAGSTTTLTSTLAGVVNTFYQITYTVTGRTAGSFTVAFGGFTSGALTATGAVGPRATTTDTLVITPTSDFNGTIVLSIRVITASSASVTFTSSGGTVTNQIRISSSITNTFIGRISGQNNTTGINNSFFGVSAGQNTTTGNNNSFVGVSAGQNTTTGNNNSFVGVNAGLNNTTGVNNSFVGVNAGRENTTGSSNSFFGGGSGLNNTTGVNNSFVGRDAGFNNTTGVNNLFVGVSAGLNNITGGGNSFFGVSSGRFIANGTTALTIVNNSVFIGAETRSNGDNESNQIVIGHSAIGAGSNTATLGNTSIVDTILRGRINLQQYATGSRPAYVKGALIYDSTLGKLVVGGNSGWEVVTSS